MCLKLCLSLSQGPDDYAGRLYYSMTSFSVAKLCEEILDTFWNSNETILEDRVIPFAQFTSENNDVFSSRCGIGGNLYQLSGGTRVLLLLPVKMRLSLNVCPTYFSECVTMKHYFIIQNTEKYRICNFQLFGHPPVNSPISA